MWHTSSNMTQPQNLPVLKNFNAYEPLQPEKVNLDKTDVSTATLIDVSDSTNILDNSLDLSLDLQGSFLEMVKKSEFDLLDLYQNMYVTPKEIKKESREDQHSENKNSIPQNDSFKIDFTEFFEKAEQGKKLYEWSKYDENLNNTIRTHPQRNFINSDSRTFNEILDNAISSRCSKLKLEPPPELDIPDPEPICEDEIDDFLHPKFIIAPSVFKDSTTTSLKSISLKSLSNPTEAYDAVNDKPLNISKLSHELLETKRSINHRDVKSQVLHENDFYENKTFVSKIEPKSDVPPIYRNEIKTSLTDLNSPPVHRLNCQKETVPMLHTVKIDPKAYNKRRIVKTDAEKNGFTKGPGIYEKSIVLPQMMKRLAERKQCLEEQQMQRKLVLETCGKHNENLNFDDSNGMVNTNKCVKTQILQSTQAPIEKVTHLMPEGASKQKEPAKLVANRKPMGFPEPEVSLKPPAYYLEPETSDALKPKVLMEDCSLKRVKALQTRIAFEKFVNTGMLPP
ncbi:uncharacterized protein [Maniola hyperantus]|uniref:uncharacterized protein n=1 Tax=Aphantopus hyperantus TaxID=2795564 RepID=UPI0015696598|nr:uncharacterized protein LOC117994890 [Maniola hyperantus]